MNGDHVTAATGRIDSVPQTLSLLLTSNSSGAQNWSYRASDRVGLVDIRVADTTGAAVNDDFSVRLEDLPLEMSLLSDTPTHSSFQSTSPVGVIEAGFAHGGPVDELADAAYLYQEAQPGYDSLAFRVLGLTRAELSTGDPTVIDVDMAAGPFHALIEDGNRTIDAQIRDLPSSIRAELSASGNQLSLEGNGRIGEIVVDASDPDGLAGRATDLDLRLVDLPESVTFGYGTDGGAAGLNAGDGVIGSVDLLLTSGPVISVADGYDGIIMEDTPDHFALVAKLNGLSEASVTTGDAPYDITLRKAPGPFLAHVVQGSRVTHIEFLDLPSELVATFDPAGALNLTGSEPIDKITATLDDPAGVSGRATHASALLEDVPTTLDVTWDASGDAVGLDAHGQTVGLLDIVLTSGPAISVPAGFDGVVLNDVPASYGVAVRMGGLKLAQLSTGGAPYTIQLDKAAGPFLVDMVQTDRHTHVELRDLPTSLDATLDPAGSLSLASSAPIGVIETTISDPAGVADRATFASARLEDVPTTLDVTWDASGGEVGVDASGQTVGLIDVLLTSGPAISVPAGFDGFVLEDVPDHYGVAIRLNQLQKAVVSTSGAPYSFDIKKQSGPFSVHLLQGARDTSIQVLDLPTSLVASMDPAGSFSYTSSAVIGQVTARVTDPAGVSGRSTLVEANLQGLPTALDVNWGGGDGSLNADAHGQTLGKIEFLMTSGPLESVAPDRDGIIVRDTDASYITTGRITGLRKVTFNQGPPPSFSLDTTGGRIFQAEIDTQKPTGISTIDAVINALPTSVSVALSTGSNFSYSASGPVNSITLDATDPDSISGRAKELHATLNSVPVRLDVATAADGTITADAFGGTVGFLQFQLTSGPNDTITNGNDGLLLNDLASKYVMFARLTGLKKAVGSTTPAPNMNLQTLGGRPFTLDLNKQASPVAKIEYNRATLLNLPATVNLTVNGSNISYSASGTATSLSFDTNVGNRWNTHADLSNPVPASFTVCQAGDVSCTPTADRTNHTTADASFRFVASEHTTVNMFDCVQPATSACPSAPTEFNRITNLRVRVLDQDARSSSSGDSGHIYVDTDNFTLSGQIHSQQGSGGFRETFGSGFFSQNRLGRWSLFGLSKTKTGTVNCPGTSLEVRFLGLWLGVTSYLC